jgi:predicted Fe-S protein YdhL (DUF1289 family)
MRGASTPTRGVPSLYVWTSWKRCCGCCCANQLRYCEGCYRDDHEEETIMNDYFLYTNTQLRWIIAQTLLLLLNVSSGNDP